MVDYAEGVLAGLLKIKYGADADYADVDGAGSVNANDISKERIDRAILKLIALKMDCLQAAQKVTNYDQPARGLTGPIAGGFQNQNTNGIIITYPGGGVNAGAIPTRLLLNEVITAKKNNTSAYRFINGSRHAPAATAINDGTAAIGAIDNTHNFNLGLDIALMRLTAFSVYNIGRGPNAG